MITDTAGFGFSKLDQFTPKISTAFQAFEF